jgi:hypothetical protein
MKTLTIALLMISITVNAQTVSVETLAKKYESTLGDSTIITRKPCDCFPCLSSCHEKRVVKKTPTYEGFIEWLKEYNKKTK